MKKISIVQHVYIITSHITVFSIRDANWMTLPIWRLESISVRLDRFKEKKNESYSYVDREGERSKNEEGDEYD